MPIGIQVKCFSLSNCQIAFTKSLSNWFLSNRCFSIPVTMRSVIKKCQDKVAAVKEELRKKQAQQMQIRPNDLHSSAGVDRHQSDSVTTFYNQQMISSDERSTNCNNLTNNKFDNFQQQPMNTPLAGNLQSMLQPNSQRTNYQARTYSAQQQQYQQPKSNTMLMTMLSDVPAANSQTSALNNSNSYFIQQQQQQQPPKNSNAMNNSFNAAAAMQQSQQQPAPKVKKQRKRKGQDTNTRSPSAVGRSPKRKMSEDELSYGSDLATPGSDYSYDNYHSMGSSQQLSRPSSTASSSNFLKT